MSGIQDSPVSKTFARSNMRKHLCNFLAACEYTVIDSKSSAIPLESSDIATVFQTYAITKGTLRVTPSKASCVSVAN